MANSISNTIQTTGTVNGQSVTHNKTATDSLSDTAVAVVNNPQQFPTGGTAEAVQKGEISTIYKAIITNLDTANKVTIVNQATVSGAVTLTDIPFGQTVVIYPNASNIYGYATTGAVNCICTLYSNP